MTTAAIPTSAIYRAITVQVLGLLLGLASTALYDWSPVGSFAVVGLGGLLILFLLGPVIRVWRNPRTRRAVATLAFLVVTTPAIWFGGTKALAWAGSGHETASIAASVGVANLTRGDSKYAHDVVAKYDDVVKIQLYYRNVAGRVLEEFTPSFRIEHAKNESVRVVADVSTEGFNRSFSTEVRLNRPDAYLQYIPESAVWKRSIRADQERPVYREARLDDSLLMGITPPLGNLSYRGRADGTVTILARVMVPSIGIQVQAPDANDDWTYTASVQRGQPLRFRVRVSNLGNVPLRDAYLYSRFPRDVHLTGRLALAKTDEQTKEVPASWLQRDLVNLGDLKVGAVATLSGNLSVPASSSAGDKKITVAVDATLVGTYHNVLQIHVE